MPTLKEHVAKLTNLRCELHDLNSRIYEQEYQIIRRLVEDKQVEMLQIRWSRLNRALTLGHLE